MRHKTILTICFFIAFVFMMKEFALFFDMRKSFIRQIKHDSSNTSVFSKEHHTTSTSHYTIMPNVATPDKAFVHLGETCICTQTSIGNLHYVSKQANTWEGEISIAVFSAGENISVAHKYIQIMRKCFDEVRENVRFHMVYPDDFPPTSPLLVTTDENCDELNKLQKRFQSENWKVKDDDMDYPVNMLRNVAIKYSTRPYLLNIDIDFLPSKGLMSSMDKYILRSNSSKFKKPNKIAYVLPAFESNTTEIIGTKAELLVAISKGTVRKFGTEKCPPCHANTNYKRWVELPSQEDMDVAYTTVASRSYEPPFIAHRDNFPRYDESFMNYGYDRFTQVCEAFMSGLTFSVMNNGFVVHDGFKFKAQFYPWRRRQNLANAHLFQTQFRDKMKKKYPNTMHLCGW